MITQKFFGRKSFQVFTELPFALILAMSLAWSLDLCIGIDTLEASHTIRFDHIVWTLVCIVILIAPTKFKKIWTVPRYRLMVCLVGFLGFLFALFSIIMSKSGVVDNNSIFGELIVVCAWLSLGIMTFFEATFVVFGLAEVSELGMMKALASLVLWLTLIGFFLFLQSVLPGVFSVAFAGFIPPVVFILAKKYFSEKDSEYEKQNVSEDARLITGSFEATSPFVLSRPNLPLNLLIVQFVVLVVVKGLGTFIPGEFKMLTGTGFVVAGICVVLLFFSRQKYVEMKHLYNATLLFIELALLLLTIKASMAGVVSGILLGAAYSIFAVFVFTLYCNVCFRYGANPYILFALALACESFASLVGPLFVRCSLEIGIEKPTIIIALSMLVAVVFLFLFKDTDYRTNWGTKHSRPSTRRVVDYYYSLPDVCSALSRQYGLSLREEDVMLLIAQKKTGPVIAEELVVSLPTVKTHTRNIYRKLGVHSRSELMKMIDCSDMFYEDEI